MRRHLPILLLLMCAAPARAQERLEVTKTARTGNPTLTVTAFEGPDEILRLLKRTIRISDWFALTDTGDADYRITGTCSGSAASHQLAITLTDVANQRTASFTKTVRNGTAADVVHHAVDELIRRAFDNPGFCTSRLAYVKALGGIKEIWTARFDGSDPRQLTHNRFLSTEPDWAADADTLLYTCYTGHRTDVVLVDVPRSRQRRLSAHPGLNSGAALNRAGDRVALTLSRDGNVELYTMSRTGSNLDRLTRTNGVESSPCWSPDDRQICYVSDQGGLRPSLRLIPAAGGTSRRLIRANIECVSPDWSARSNMICFAMRKGGRYTIAILDMKTPDARPETVVDLPGDWESPSWARDGRHIVCSGRNANGRYLALVDSWYRTITPLRNFTGDDSLPSYSGE